MAIVKIIKEGQLLESTSEQHVYPVTVFEAVLNKDNKNITEVLNNIQTQIEVIKGTAIDASDAIERVEIDVNNNNTALRNIQDNVNNLQGIVENVNNTTSTMYNIKGVIKASDVIRGIDQCTELIAQPGKCATVSSFKEKDLYFLTTPGTYNLSGTPKAIDTLHMAIYQNGDWQYLDMQIPLIPSLVGVADGSYLKYSNGKLIWAK